MDKELFHQISSESSNNINNIELIIPKNDSSLRKISNFTDYFMSHSAKGLERVIIK